MHEGLEPALVVADGELRCQHLRAGTVLQLQVDALLQRRRVNRMGEADFVHALLQVCIERILVKRAAGERGHERRALELHLILRQVHAGCDAYVRIQRDREVLAHRPVAGGLEHQAAVVAPAPGAGERRCHKQAARRGADVLDRRGRTTEGQGQGVHDGRGLRIVGEVRRVNAHSQRAGRDRTRAQDEPADEQGEQEQRGDRAQPLRWLGRQRAPRRADPGRRLPMPVAEHAAPPRRPRRPRRGLPSAGLRRGRGVRRRWRGHLESRGAWRAVVGIQPLRQSRAGPDNVFLTF